DGRTLLPAARRARQHPPHGQALGDRPDRPRLRLTAPRVLTSFPPSAVLSFRLLRRGNGASSALAPRPKRRASWVRNVRRDEDGAGRTAPAPDLPKSSQEPRRYRD